MKRILCIIALAFSLMACAGNPPRWWNPGNTYSSTSRQSVSDEAFHQNIPAASAVGKMDSVAEVELITPVQDDGFEEMLLTPLQDEDTEDASLHVQDGSTMTVTPSASAAPADDVLPPPSVLE